MSPARRSASWPVVTGRSEAALPVAAAGSGGALTAAGAEEVIVPASAYRALQNQVRELHRLLGKKTLEDEILKEALEVAAGPKEGMLLALVDGGLPMKTVANVIGVARSRLAE